MERWYICENGTGCCEHVGHLEKQEAEVKRMAKDVKEEELEIARDQLDTNHHSAAVSALVAKRTGVRLTTVQLVYQQKLCEVTTLSSKEGGCSSAADKLIAYFHKKDNISYVCLFDEIETDLITIPKQRKSRRIKCIIHEHSNETNIDIPTLDIDDESPGQDSKCIVC